MAYKGIECSSDTCIPGSMTHGRNESLNSPLSPFFLSHPSTPTHRQITMTEHGFPSLANELVLQIAFYADDSSVLSLLLCNTSLCALMTPVLQTRAVLPHGPQTAMQWAAARGHLNLVKVCYLLHPPPPPAFPLVPSLDGPVSAGARCAS